MLYVWEAAVKASGCWQLMTAWRPGELPRYERTRPVITTVNDLNLPLWVTRPLAVAD